MSMAENMERFGFGGSSQNMTIYTKENETFILSEQY